MPKNHSDHSPPSDSDLDTLFDRAMRTLRKRPSRALGSLFAGSIGAAGATGCDVEAASLPTTTMSAAQALGNWAQKSGERNTELVSYDGAFWDECSFTTRFCSMVDLFVKVRVRPVEDAQALSKKVGLTYRTPYDSLDRTVSGTYFTTYANGDEEWHVPVRGLSHFGHGSSPGDVITFTAWYEPFGAGNKVFYDDNGGEFHMATGASDHRIAQLTNPWALTVDDAGVRGTLEMSLIGLDHDKEIELVGTTNGWADKLTFGIGEPGQKNAWYWVATDHGRERWAIDLDLDLPGAGDFEFAAVYRHGVRNDARPYEFWDNGSGDNYVASAQ